MDANVTTRTERTPLIPLRINTYPSVGTRPNTAGDPTDGELHDEVVQSFVGRRLRARHIEQRTQGFGTTGNSPNHTLVFHISGGAVERYDGRRRTGHNDKSGATTAVPAHAENRWHIPQSANILHLYLDDTDLRHFALREFGYDDDKLEVRDHMGVDDGFMQHFGCMVLEELRSNLPKSQLTLDGFDYTVAGHILRAYSNFSDKTAAYFEEKAKQCTRRQIRTIQDILNDRMAENISASELGDEIGISPFRLMRLFKSECTRRSLT